MTAIRSSKMSPTLTTTFAGGVAQVLNHSPYVGVAILGSGTPASVTLSVSMSSAGPWKSVTLENQGAYYWPAENQMYLLYNAAYIQANCDTAFRVFQKS